MNFILNFFISDGMQNFYFNPINNDGNIYQQPMQPMRIEKTNELVVSYKLEQYMNIIKPKPAADSDLKEFHSDDYIEFLQHYEDKK